jgi:murein DD-endopeptidase MepM/ murein hydrolase activator NlpD
VTQRPSAGIYHVVKRGENLFRIGKAYDIPHTQLAAINKLPDPSRIHVGQRIFIPGAAQPLPVEVITPGEPGFDVEKHPPDHGSVDAEFIWPIAGTVVSSFGPRSGTFHDGIDISAPEGMPIRAVAAGEVIYSSQLRGYGNLIIIRHENGLVSVYSHNRKNLVEQGAKVDKGEIIGEVGSTGRVSGPHLHFEVRRGNRARDPLEYLPRQRGPHCEAC